MARACIYVVAWYCARAEARAYGCCYGCENGGAKPYVVMLERGSVDEISSNVLVHSHQRKLS